MWVSESWYLPTISLQLQHFKPNTLYCLKRLLLSAVDQIDCSYIKMVEWNNFEKKGIVKFELKQSV